MLENIEIFINYSNYSIKELFKVLNNSDNINRLPFINIFCENMADESDFNKVCELALYDKKVVGCFEDDELELLRGFFSVLGQTDSTGQIINCQTYKVFFKQRLSVLEAQEKIKCKNQTAMVLGLSFMISIIIL